jgi:hypothetical protein
MLALTEVRNNNKDKSVIASDSHKKAEPSYRSFKDLVSVTSCEISIDHRQTDKSM